MAVTKIRKISSWTLLLISLISVVVFATFYMGGIVDPNAEKPEPVFTSLLLYWSYIIFFITVACLLFFSVLQFISTLKSNPKKALMSLGVLVLLVALLAVNYALGNGDALPGINIDSAKFNVPSWLKISDMWIFTTYELLTLCVLAIIGGSVKKIFSK